MKTLRLRPSLALGLAVGFLLVVTTGTFAQTSNTLPIVRIRAADGVASESGDPGLFVVSRDGGGTNQELKVFYHIGGSASNGQDYGTISNSVTIPPGAWQAGIAINPLEDNLVEGTESVELALTPSPGVLGYFIGFPSNAVVLIADNDRPTETNLPPTVRLVSPTNNSSFTAPADILLIAQANDPNGYMTVQTVEFFAGTNSLGITTNYPTANPIGPFHIVWSNVPPGEYVLSAKATDDHGAVGVSDGVHIAVRQPSPIAIVTISAPDAHASEGGFGGGVSNSVSDIGVFTIARRDHTNVDLTVYYRIGGSASNGVDYSTIPNSVVIPAGAFFANILIKPVDDNLIEGTETVEIALVSPACAAIFPPPADCYIVGSPSNAVVFIEDNDRITNAPPKVHIISPTNGAVFAGPATIPTTAEAADPDGNVVRVEFFAGDHFLGRDVGTNDTIYGIVWSNALPGLYSLQARAYDDRGAVGLSEPVRITVTGTNEPPTNLPPVVTIFAVDPIAGEGTNCFRWYTNVGVYSNTFPTPYPYTNTATFAVRRSGSTTSSLTVNYEIGGTASNGVDYVTIPSSVTIPSGEHSAKVVIQPIDDNIPECAETVILHLLQATNAPVPYLVGWPGRAAAVIVDNDQLPPGTGPLCDRTFHVSSHVTNGMNYRVEVSLDLVHWLPVGTNTVSEPDVHFADPESQDFPNRFYRILPDSGVMMPPR